jgi:ATP-dependent Clp protease adapter protein ClpS
MYRATAHRSRLPKPQPQPIRPRLVLIEGGKSDEIPIVRVFHAVSCLLFLNEVSSLIERNRQRRHNAPAQVISPIRSKPAFTRTRYEPVTGVHPVVFDRALDDIIDRAKAKDQRRPFYVPRHVLRQYVRWVLCYRGGLNNLLKKRAKDVMVRVRDQGRGGKNFDLVRELEFEAVQTSAKRWLLSATDTGRKTARGYAILQARDKDGCRVFVTLHHDGRTVIGIYTEKQFGREKRFSGSRKLSNQRARAYRKTKANLRPR